MGESVEEIAGQIEWFESLLACLNDGEIEAVKEVVEAAIKLLRSKAGEQ